MTSEHPAIPAFMAFFAAVLWGIWWIPIRHLESLGMDGAWGSIAMNVGAVLIALLWMVLNRITFKVSGKGLIGAALVGVAVTTYSTAITMSDVVRVILLFYLAPAWGKIIEFLFLGRGWGWNASFALIASLTGAWLVLGADLSLAGIGTGDLLAILSGLAWACGAAFLFTDQRTSPISLAFISGISAIILGLIFIWLGTGIGVSGQANWNGAANGVFFGAVYVLPIIVMTLWSAQRLAPAVISFLLTAEILSGVLSGVVLLDDPFGALQATGAGLIILAAMSQVSAGLRQH